MDYKDVVSKAAKTLNLLDGQGQLARLDSMTIIDFVLELEGAAGVEIPNSRLTQDTFASVDSVAALISELKG